MSINLSTFWTTWNVLSGNTSATNQYDFWRGLVMDDNTRINSQYDFFKYHNTTRYQFFNDLNSTYPEVWNETTFYQNTNDARIYNYDTFYYYGAQSLPTGLPNPIAFPIAKELLFADCFVPINDTTYYTNNISTLANGVILYVDDTLTATVAGFPGVYYSEFEGASVIATFEIDVDGSILNYTLC